MSEKIVPFHGENFVCNNSFLPNLTSSLILESVLEIGVQNRRVLDLGCGCGALGLSILRAGPASVTLSDISEGALKDSLTNSERLKEKGADVKVRVIKSDGLQTFQRGEHFDLIMNDVSGVAEGLARISPWFERAPCESGEDGLAFFKEIVLSAPDCLSQNGVIVTPLLSLSNARHAHQFLEKTVSTYRVIKKKTWFLPESMSVTFKREIDGLVEAGHVNVDYKFGRFVAWTEVLAIEKSAYR